MEHIVRVQKHTEHEIVLGHKVSFTPYDGDRKLIKKAISVTANLRGFVPLTSVLRHYKIDQQNISELVSNANKHKVISTFTKTFREPIFILVPKTYGSNKQGFNVEYYISRVISFCNHENIKQLQFLHYSFVNSELQQSELIRILKVVLNPLTHVNLETFVWEIDARAVKQFDVAFDFVANKIFRLGMRVPRKINAPEFQYIDDSKLNNGWYTQRLVLKNKDESRCLLNDS